MKISRKKLELAKARACMTTKELIAAGIPQGTLSRAMAKPVNPATIGKIAKALGVDVLDIIENE